MLRVNNIPICRVQPASWPCNSLWWVLVLISMKDQGLVLITSIQFPVFCPEHTLCMHSWVCILTESWADVRISFYILSRNIVVTLWFTAFKCIKKLIYSWKFWIVSKEQLWCTLVKKQINNVTDVMTYWKNCPSCLITSWKSKHTN